MDQRKRAATRGYGYVGLSRFRTKAGCFLYGRLRVSDFLPVGESCEDDVVERGYESMSSGSDSDADMGKGIELAYEQRSSLAGGLFDDTGDAGGHGIEGQSSSSGVQDVDLAPISQPVAQASSLHPRPEGGDSDDELPPEEFHDVGCILADFQV